MLLLLASALLAGGSPADLAPSQAVAQSPAKPVKEKKICRSQMDTGSILPKTICHTQAEWNEVSGTNRGEVNEMNRRQENSQMMQASRP
jgi:hypothetical protein